MYNNKFLFVVVGRLGESLTISKITPFIQTKRFNKIIVFRQSPGPELPTVQYVTLQGLNKLKNRYLIRFVRVFAEPLQIIYYAFKLKPEIINGYHLIPKGLYTVFACKLSRSKSMVSSIGGIPEITTYMKPTWFWKKLNVTILHKADIITTKGEVMNNYMQLLGIDKKKIFVFNGAIDVSKYNNEAGISKDIDAIFVGTFRKLKGPDRFVHIIHNIHSVFPNIKAVMLGDGILKAEIIELINKLNLQNNIQVIGFTNDTVKYFRQSKILIMPSESEGVPTSMLEAMSCECVPVISNVGNVSEAAIHKQNAYLVDNFDDIDSFTNYTRELLEKEEVRKTIVANGLQTIQEKYTVEAQGQVLSNIFKAFDLAC